MQRAKTRVPRVRFFVIHGRGAPSRAKYVKRGSFAVRAFLFACPRERGPSFPTPRPGFIGTHVIGTN